MGQDESFVTDYLSLDSAIDSKLPANFKDNLSGNIATCLRYSFDIADRGCTLNLSLERTKEGERKLQFNFHYDVTGRESSDVEQTIASYESSYTFSESLINSLVTTS